jgi:hypothetical protein
MAHGGAPMPYLAPRRGLRSRVSTRGSPSRREPGRLSATTAMMTPFPKIHVYLRVSLHSVSGALESLSPNSELTNSAPAPAPRLAYSCKHMSIIV